jgi:twitching motility two-component system response regulator PilG
VLGIGHLNLHNYQFGLDYLSRAAELEPNDVVLGSQVNALRIRLDEIRRRDESHESKPKGKTIMVVDDSPTVRKLISGKLEKCGHAVFCAGDGVEAVEQLASLVPDLVLLDINMPRMDGYQVCKAIRSNPATQDVPVIMISGKDGFFDKVRGRMAGTTGYITKPFGPETLMKAVESYLVGSSESPVTN